MSTAVIVGKQPEIWNYVRTWLFGFLIHLRGAMPVRNMPSCFFGQLNWPVILCE